jgi:hypothetical protein
VDSRFALPLNTIVDGAYRIERVGHPQPGLLCCRNRPGKIPRLARRTAGFSQAGQAEAGLRGQVPNDSDKTRVDTPNQGRAGLAKGMPRARGDPVNAVSRRGTSGAVLFSRVVRRSTNLRERGTMQS